MLVSSDSISDFKVDECESQFAVMQVAMDLVLSPVALQRQRVQKVDMLFHCAGTGLYPEIASHKFLCESFSKQLARNTQMNSVLCM